MVQVLATRSAGSFDTSIIAGGMKLEQPERTLEDRFRELNLLKEKGFVTEDEYQIKRRELLDEA